MIKLLVVTVLITIISSCSSNSNKKSKVDLGNEEITRKTLLVGNESNLTKAVVDMVEQSNIRKGGYVVIIPTTYAISKSATKLKKLFNKKNIKAVHIITIDQDTDIKNSDVLAIENARIICLLDGRKNMFMKRANNTRLKKSLNIATENGSLVAGIGNGATIIGEYYFDEVKNSETQKERLVMRPGLGLIKNTAIADKSLVNNYKEFIQNKTKKKNVLTIGMSNQASVLINNNSGIAIGNSNIILITPDDKIRNLNIGDEFSLLPDKTQK